MVDRLVCNLIFLHMHELIFFFFFLLLSRTWPNGLRGKRRSWSKRNPVHHQKRHDSCVQACVVCKELKLKEDHGVNLEVTVCTWMMCILIYILCLSFVFKSTTQWLLMMHFLLVLSEIACGSCEMLLNTRKKERKKNKQYIFIVCVCVCARVWCW